MRSLPTTLFGLLILGFAGTALAQDANPQPNPAGVPGFGAISLTSGFTPDPHVIPVVSGGSIPARSVAANCTGHVSRAPDVRLTYTSGDMPLIISVASQADTTLLIQGPSGSWHCDDDGGVNGSNPSIRWNTPQSGVYAIWIGSYRSGANTRAELHISEVRSQ
jgi:hypothetical protein